MTDDYVENRLAFLLTKLSMCRAQIQLGKPREAMFDPACDIAMAAAELANRVAPDGYKIVVQRKDWRES